MYERFRIRPTPSDQANYTRISDYHIIDTAHEQFEELRRKWIGRYGNTLPIDHLTPESTFLSHRIWWLACIKVDMYSSLGF